MDLDGATFLTIIFLGVGISFKSGAVGGVTSGFSGAMGFVVSL